MTLKRALLLIAFCAVGLLVPGLLPSRTAQANPAIFASPVQAGCYLARRDRCKIHVEPISINLAPGSKLVRFQLVAIRSTGGLQKVIYDFRPDQSNPAPLTGSVFNPTKVAKDFAATCGQAYTLSLQGQDTLGSSMLNLGLTGTFTCPVGTFIQNLPIVRR